MTRAGGKSALRYLSKDEALVVADTILRTLKAARLSIRGADTPHPAEAALRKIPACSNPGGNSGPDSDMRVRSRN